MAQAVFVDTSAWYALVCSSDPEHAAAKRAWGRLQAGAPAVSTSDWVLAELIALSERRLGRPTALRVGSLLLSDDAVRIMIVDRQTVERAWTRYGARGGPSLVDCSSFELMRQNAIGDFFAYDEDFRREGFRPFGGA